MGASVRPFAPLATGCHPYSHPATRPWALGPSCGAVVLGRCGHATALCSGAPGSGGWRRPMAFSHSNRPCPSHWRMSSLTVRRTTQRSELPLSLACMTMPAFEGESRNPTSWSSALLCGRPSMLHWLSPPSALIGPRRSSSTTAWKAGEKIGRMPNVGGRISGLRRLLASS